MNRHLARETLVLIFLIGAAIHYGKLQPARADENAVISGKITDVDGRPVEGARVYLYDSPDVRRSANFMTAPSDRNGLYRMAVPPGAYWAAARLKWSEGYGALMPGDKHSGDPVKIEMQSGREKQSSFIVMDLREAMKATARERERLVRISGRILDTSGSPVPGAYAVAHRSARIEGIPDHCSASVDADGYFTLSLPRGKYYFGSADVFPPESDAVMTGEIPVESDMAGFDLPGKPQRSTKAGRSTKDEQ